MYGHDPAIKCDRRVEVGLHGAVTCREPGNGRRTRRQRTDYRARTKRAFICRLKMKPQQTVKTMSTVRLDNLIKISYETSVLYPAPVGNS